MILISAYDSLIRLRNVIQNRITRRFKENELKED